MLAISRRCLKCSEDISCASMLINVFSEWGLASSEDI